MIKFLGVALVTFGTLLICYASTVMALDMYVTHVHHYWDVIGSFISGTGIYGIGIFTWDCRNPG